MDSEARIFQRSIKMVDTLAENIPKVEVLGLTTEFLQLASSVSKRIVKQQSVSKWTCWFDLQIDDPIKNFLVGRTVFL